MALAQQALNPLPLVPGVAITCHVATWFWAAQEAHQRRLCAAKPALVTLGNIAGMALPPQPGILALLRSGTWDFGITPITPPAGTVLVWPDGATHSAVVTALNAITGYNQVAQFPALLNQFGHTTATPAQLAPAHRRCAVVAEDTLVTRAGQLNL
jgi:hypothetical protein